jgi:hypothetical protein
MLAAQSEGVSSQEAAAGGAERPRGVSTLPRIPDPAQLLQALSSQQQTRLSASQAAAMDDPYASQSFADDAQFEGGACKGIVGSWVVLLRR